MAHFQTGRLITGPVLFLGGGGGDGVAWRPVIFASSALLPRLSVLRFIRGVSLVPNHRAQNPAQPSRARRSCLGCETRPRALSRALALSRLVSVMVPLYRHFPHRALH